MTIPKYTADDFRKLPLRAIVAIASRCARRVESLAVPPAEHSEHQRCKEAVRRAIGMTEDFARGDSTTTTEAVVQTIEAVSKDLAGDSTRDNALAAVLQAAYSAATALHALELRAEPEEKHLFGPPTRPFAHLADLSAEQAALNAATAAVDAAAAAGYSDAFIKAVVADFEQLLRLNLGSYPLAGEPVDPTPAGPLGPLWETEPEDPA